MNFDLDLTKVNLFKGLDKETIESILEKYAVIKEYKKDEFIFRKGDTPKYMYILIEGALSVFSDDINGKRELLSYFDEPGTLFGEVYLYMEKGVYHFSAAANQDMKAIALSKNFFNTLYLKKNNVGLKIMENYLEILSEKLFYFNRKIRMMSGFTLRQKLARFILEKSEESNYIDLGFSREELADYLGATRPSISRELSKMQSEELIDLDRSNLKILNREELKKYT